MASDQKILLRVGGRISEVRRDSGMTQAALAEKLGVTDKYVQQIEYGQVNIPLVTLGQIAGALGVEITALFDPPTTLKPKPGRPPKT
jgi:transcriptional regulator with XRE-family HTH domain